MRPSRLMTAVVPKQKRNEPSHVYRYVRTGTDSIQTIKYPCKPNKIKLAVRNVGAGRPASLRTTTPPSPSGVPGRGRVAVDRSRPERAIVILFFFVSRERVGLDRRRRRRRSRTRTHRNQQRRARRQRERHFGFVNRATRHRDGRTDVCCFNSFARFVSSARSRRNRNAREGRVVDSIRLCGRSVRFSTDSRIASHRIDTEGNDGARCG